MHQFYLLCKAMSSTYRYYATFREQCNVVGQFPDVTARLVNRGYPSAPTQRCPDEEGPTNDGPPRGRDIPQHLHDTQGDTSVQARSTEPLAPLHQIRIIHSYSRLIHNQYSGIIDH